MLIGRMAVAEELAKLRTARGLAARAAIVGGCAIFLCACNTDQQVTAGAPSVPYDYRQRHPITITEGNQTLELFVGTSRGELNAGQRAEVAQFGHRWRREASGGVVIELPVGATNERAAAETVHTVRSILAATSVPPNGIIVRGYQAPGPNIAPIRISFPRVMAQAGPCGIWPEDIGPSFNRNYFENQPVWNHGCSSQRNLAAMVDDPADLVQPRGETPSYTQRRTTVLDKYRAGQPTAATIPDPKAGKLSDVGQ